MFCCQRPTNMCLFHLIKYFDFQLYLISQVLSIMVVGSDWDASHGIMVVASPQDLVILWLKSLWSRALWLPLGQSTPNNKLTPSARYVCEPSPGVFSQSGSWCDFITLSGIRWEVLWGVCCTIMRERSKPETEVAPTNMFQASVHPSDKVRSVTQKKGVWQSEKQEKKRLPWADAGRK